MRNLFDPEKKAVIGLFLCLFQINALGLGLLVACARSAESSVQKAAMVAALQALAGLLALRFQNFVNLKRQDFLRTSCWVAIASTTSIYFFDPFRLFWFVGLFISLMALTYLSAAISSKFSTVLSKSDDISVKFQFINIIALALAMTIGPLILEWFGLKALLFLVLLSCVLLLPTLFVFAESSSATATNDQFDLKSNSSALVWINFLVWSGVGIFNVIELPMLVERFSATSALITGILLVTLFSNLVGSKCLPLMLSVNSKQFTILGGFGLLLVSLAYLNNYSFSVLFLLIALFGILNAVYNLGQYGIVFASADHIARTRLLLNLRISMQLGILAGTGFIFCVQHFEMNLIRTLSAFLVGLTLIFLCFGRLKPGLSKTAFAILISMIVFHSTVWSEETGKFRIGVYSIPEKVDPARVLDMSHGFIARQLCYYLYRFNSSNDLEPELAESHLVLDDGRTYELTLKKNKHFSDGMQISAFDVVASINRVLRIGGDSMRWALGNIRGYQASVRSLQGGEFKPMVGVKAISADKLRIELDRPFRDFLQVLATPYLGIVKQTKANEILYSDQYSIKYVSPFELRLIPTDHNPLSKEKVLLNFIKIDSPTVGFQMAKRAELDWIYPVEIDLKAKGFNEVKFDSLNVVILQLNSSFESFKKDAQRCLILKSFRDVVSKIPNIGERISLGLPFTGGIFSSQLSTKVQASGKAEPRSIDLDYIDSIAAFKSSDLEAISSEMRDRGYSIKFRKRSLKDFLENAKSGSFKMVLWGYGLDYFSPDALLSPLLGSNQQFNFSRFSNRTLDNLLNQGRSSLSDDSRAKVYDSIFALVSQHCPVTFLGTQRQKILLSERYDLLSSPPSVGPHTLIISESLRRTRK